MLELNAIDNQRRKFILIQLRHDNKEQEKAGFNVCEEAAAARLRKVIEGYTYKTNGKKKVEVDALGGSFGYARVGEPLFGEYKNFGKNPPAWQTIGRFIFYTETSREADPKKLNEKTGFIGEIQAAGGTSYYLFYSPDNEENQKVSLRTLPGIIERDKNRNLVIYAERIWLHADELAKLAAEHKRRIRTMVVPFGLK